MDSGTTEPARPVGRGLKMRVAVYSATLSELAEHGYSALTIDNVARRAGVHKTTIYRGWINREKLVFEALTERTATQIPIPDTGSVSGDLTELAAGVVAMQRTPVGLALLTALSSDAARVPEIGETMRRAFADRFQRGTPVITRAIARGELPADTDPVAVLRTLIAPIYLRLTITGEALDNAVVDQAVAVALAAARAGVLRAR